jgi:hypothetical protein
LGIGTASPISGAYLDIVSSGVAYPRVRSTTATAVATYYQNSASGTTNTDGLFVGMDGSLNGYLYNYENAPLIFGVNNAEQMRLTSSLLSVVPGATIQGLTVGRGAGAVATNTAVGVSALGNNSTGSQNTAVGYQTGLSITTGDKNTAFGASIMDQSAGVTGQENSAFGRVSMRFLTSGSYNTALGNESLLKVTSGSNNTAVGFDALLENTTASNNTAVGYQAGYSNTTGATNVAIGFSALRSNTTSSNNTAVGSQAAYSTTGVSNAAFGANTLYTNSSGNYNAAFGQEALFSNTTASENTAVGYQALYSQTTAGTGSNTALGHQAGYTTNGFYNTFIGYKSGLPSTGNQNTFIGHGSGSAMTSGSKNTILGVYNGNQGGLDIRTASNYIVLSDGDGNPLISTADNQTVALEGAVPNSGTGITFPATQSASSNANTLDDYEEGTFTPVIADGITSPTYTVQNGTYTKIGRLVTYSIRLTLSAGTAAANLIQIGGLPFTAASAPRGMAGSIAYASGSVINSTSINMPVFEAGAGTSTLNFYKTNGSQFLGTDLATASTFDIDLGGQYFV